MLNLGTGLEKEWESEYWSREIMVDLDESEYVDSLTAVVEATFFPVF